MGRLGLRLVIGVIFVVVQMSPVSADMDIEQIRLLVEQQQILPLEQVISVIEMEIPGRAIEVELEHKDAGFVYEIEWLDQQGRVWEFKLDARSAVILERELD